MTIRDNHGERVGHVSDLILDLSEGRVAYVGIDLHSDEANCRKRATIPWSAVYFGGAGNEELRVAARAATLARIAHLD